MTHYRHALIVGASSGIGLAIAQMLAAQGVHVALVARRGDQLKTMCDQINQRQQSEVALAYQHDVLDITEVPELFQRITHDLGGLDLVIYAAGTFPHAKPQEYNTAEDAMTIQVNLIGAMAWLNEAATRFGMMKTGTIVAISSVAGDRGRRGLPAYNVSKAAMTTYMESLRNRLSVLGVSVITIKPGFVKTAMTAGAKIPAFLPIISTDRAARDIVSAIHRKQQVAYVPGIWRPIMALVRAIPSPIFRRLNI